MHSSSVSICLTGSNYNVQAVESDYDDDESTKPLLPPGSKDDDKLYPEEEVNHSQLQVEIAIRNTLNPLISWRLKIRTLA